MTHTALTPKTNAEMLDAYKIAEERILEGQEVTFNGKRLTRADLAAVRAGRREYQKLVNYESRGGGLAAKSVWGNE